jgi:hypothetical protein
VAHDVVSPIPEYRPALQFAHVGGLPLSFCPGKHATQTDDPAPDTLPEAHVAHAESPPSAVNVPALQLMQTLATVCAVLSEYLPGEQLLHCVSAAAPCALEYFPVPHGLHVSVVCSVSSPYFPAPHAVHNALPAII